MPQGEFQSEELIGATHHHIRCLSAAAGAPNLNILIAVLLSLTLSTRGDTLKFGYKK